MIIGIGTDILKIEKLHPPFLKDNDPFLLKTFTLNEMNAANHSDHRIHYFADRFAGKEAVFKAIGISGNFIQLSEIEILNDENGVPYVLLHGNVKEQAKRKGITNIHISLSFEDEYAIAYAIAESNKGE